MGAGYPWKSALARRQTAASSALARPGARASERGRFLLGRRLERGIDTPRLEREACGVLHYHQLLQCRPDKNGRVDSGRFEAAWNARSSCPLGISLVARPSHANKGV